VSLLEQRVRWDALVKARTAPGKRVVVLSTFSVDPVVPYLGTELEDRGLAFDVRVGPYGQIAQQCLDPASETARGGCDVLVVWPRFEDLWAGRPAPLEATDSGYGEALLELAAVAADAARRWSATLVFVLPSVPDTLPLGVGDLRNPNGVIATATRARELAADHLRKTGAWIADADRMVRSVGARRAYDPRLATLARIPFTQELYAEAGAQVARLVALAHKPAKKVVVVDGDNTLWGGVIGEVGWEHVDLADNAPGEAFRELQTFLRDLRRAGWLLALCSKNDDADIRQVFTRTEMRIGLADFVTRRVGWDSKAVSIAAIAEELGLGLDSFVFLDDNPHEIAEVTAKLPMVTCIQIPADIVHWRTTLERSGAFDRPPPTATDLARAAQYDVERERQTIRERFASNEAYLADLGIQIRVYPPREEHIARLVQLIAKTNQFNLNGRRRTEAELRALCASDQHVVLLAEARDRFGDYGQIGAVIVDLTAPDRAILDTFLLSCRVLGRGIEEAVLAETRTRVAIRGVTELIATVEIQPRNEPARTFFARLGATEPARPTPLVDVPRPPHVEVVPT
jgi:FkbH-like protein